MDIEDRPFQVASTGVTAGGAFSLSCGGSLITSRHVLTAAHCFPNPACARALHGMIMPTLVYTKIEFVPYDNNLPVRYIRAGSNLFNAGGVISRVTLAVNAPTYDLLSANEDISVLALETPIIANGNTIAYGLIGNPDSVLSDGLASIVSSWGNTSPGGFVSAQLLEVEVFLINWQVCHDRYEERDRLPAWWPPLLQVSENMICAGILDVGGKDACHGDSGGPLTVQYAIYGVVSWGYSCADYHFPGVYTDVQPHVSWIIETVASV